MGPGLLRLSTKRQLHLCCMGVEQWAQSGAAQAMARKAWFVGLPGAQMLCDPFFILIGASALA